jgi:hypothetical protein
MLIVVSMAGIVSAGVGDVHDLLTDVTANGGWTTSGSPAVGEWNVGTTQTIGDFTPFDIYLGGPTVWHTEAYLGLPFNAANANVGHITPHTYFTGSVYLVAENTITGDDNVLDAGEYYSLYSAIRWTAPATIAANQDVTVEIALGNVEGDSATATDTWVAQGTNILFEQAATSPETDTFSGLLNTSVNPGDTIDVLIKRNIAADGWHAAISNMHMTVTEVPEPMTIGLLAMGGLALLRRKR